MTNTAALYIGRKAPNSPEVLAARYALVAAQVTLDGHPAKVCGARLPFARVRSGASEAEFAWETVARIVARDGAFKS